LEIVDSIRFKGLVDACEEYVRDGSVKEGREWEAYTREVFGGLDSVSRQLNQSPIHNPVVSGGRHSGCAIDIAHAVLEVEKRPETRSHLACSLPVFSRVGVLFVRKRKTFAILDPLDPPFIIRFLDGHVILGRTCDCGTGEPNKEVAFPWS
jgi:hypothetical protein